MTVFDWVMIWMGVSAVVCLCLGYVMGAGDFDGDYK